MGIPTFSFHQKSKGCWKQHGIDSVETVVAKTYRKEELTLMAIMLNELQALVETSRNQKSKRVLTMNGNRV